jgi:predicted dehydrogenase
MASEKKVRIAVVGAGHVAQVAHIPGYRQNPSAELVAVVDDDPVKARRIKEQFGFAEWYEDISDMLKKADVDAVDICTPNYLHASMTIAALRSGRHVICEKPLARSAAEAQRMVDTAEEKGRYLMVAMNNRFRQDVQTLATIVKGGELGDVHIVKAGWLRRTIDWKEREWFTDAGKAGGGALLDLGTPIMDLAIWISALRRPTGVTCSVFGKKGKKGVEESGCAMIRFAGGASLMLEVNWNLREPADKVYVQIYGSKGGAMLNPLQIHKSIHGVLVNVTPAIEKRNYYKASYQAEIDHFIESIQKRRKPRSSGEEALAVLKILDAMYESAATGREVEIQP